MGYDKWKLESSPLNDFDSDLEDKYIRAKHLVQDAKSKLTNIINSKHYEIWSTKERHERDIEWAKKVLIRCEMYCSDIQDLYFTQEREMYKR